MVFSLANLLAVMGPNVTFANIDPHQAKFRPQPLAFDQPQRFESGIGVFRTASRG
jgi:hypothetical protein